MQNKQTEQFNVTIPLSLVKRIEKFMFNYEMTKKETAEMILEVGIEICEQKMKEKIKQNN